MNSRFAQFAATRAYVIPLLILVGLGPGLYKITDESLWCDEQYTVEYSTLPTVPALIARTGEHDVHPPLYYLLMHPWLRLFGTSELALRLPSLLLACATVLMLYFAGSYAGGPAWGFTAALILAFLPWHVYYAQEARNYTLLGVLLTSSICLSAYTRKHATTRLHYVLFALLGFCLSFTHAYGHMIVFTLCVVLLGHYLTTRRREHLVAAGCAAFGAALAVALWAPFLAGNISRFDASVHVRTMSAREFVSFFGRPLLAPLPSKPALVAGLGLLVTCFLLAFSYTEKREPWRWRIRLEPTVLMAATWLVLPVALIAAISFWRDAWLAVRLVALALPPMALLLAACILYARRRAFAWVIAAVLSVVLLAGLAQVYGRHQKQEWREVGKFIAAQERPGDCLVVMDNGVIEHLLQRYYPGQLPITGLSRSVKDPAALRAEMARLWPARGRLWFVLSHGFGNPLPRVLKNRWPGSELTLDRQFVAIRLMLFSGPGPPPAWSSPGTTPAQEPAPPAAEIPPDYDG